MQFLLQSTGAIGENKFGAEDESFFYQYLILRLVQSKDKLEELQSGFVNSQLSKKLTCINQRKVGFEHLIILQYQETLKHSEGIYS